MSESYNIRRARRLMGALLRMPPKPHSEMKVGKANVKPKPLLPNDNPHASKRRNNRGKRANNRNG